MPASAMVARSSTRPSSASPAPTAPRTASRRTARHEEQRDPLVGARRDDEPVRHVAVEHVGLLAAQPPALAAALGAGRDARGIEAAPRLLIGERDEALARGHCGQVRAALRLLAAE